MPSGLHRKSQGMMKISDPKTRFFFSRSHQSGIRTCPLGCLEGFLPGLKAITQSFPKKTRFLRHSYDTIFFGDDESRSQYRHFPPQSELKQ